MQLYIRRCFIICMCKILVQNFIIKDILKKEKRCSLKLCTDYRNNLLLKNSFVSTPDRRQSKTLFIDERGSEIATTSVFDCHLSRVGRLMAIKNYVSNYFGLRSSIVLTFSIVSYPVWFRCTLHEFCIQLNQIIWNALCL